MSMTTLSFEFVSSIERIGRNNKNIKYNIRFIYGTNNNSTASKIKLLGGIQNKIAEDCTLFIYGDNIIVWTSDKIKLVDSLGRRGIFAETNFNKVDLTNVDSSDVQNMSALFYRAHIKEIILSELDTSNCRIFSHMFDTCAAKKVDISNFNTSKAISMVSMFESFKGEILGLDKIDTSNVTSMKNMFLNCESPRIKLDNFSYNSIEHLEGMLKNCKSNITGNTKIKQLSGNIYI